MRSWGFDTQGIKYWRYGVLGLSFNGLSLENGQCECAYSTWAKILFRKSKLHILGGV